MSVSDVVIVGGGAIGLGIAWRLAQRGAAVTVVDRGPMAAEASSNATGVIQPLTDPGAPPEYLDLCLASHRLVPGFVEGLREAAGLDPEYGATGILRVRWATTKRRRWPGISPGCGSEGFPWSSWTAALFGNASR